MSVNNKKYHKFFALHRYALTTRSGGGVLRAMEAAPSPPPGGREPKLIGNVNRPAHPPPPIRYDKYV